MLGPIVRRLGGKRIILASESPRRKAILAHIGLPFDVLPSSFEENLDKSKFPEPWEYAVENSKGKALEVADKLEEDETWAVIIGADTIVVKDGEIFEKPGSQSRAREMLEKLNDATHEVITGLTIVYRNVEDICQVNCYEITQVTIDSLSDEVISSYISSGEPLDKAGGYGIQDVGGTIVKSIAGDYYNIVGLPLNRLCKELLKVLSDSVSD